MPLFVFDTLTVEGAESIVDRYSSVRFRHPVQMRGMRAVRVLGMLNVAPETEHFDEALFAVGNAILGAPVPSDCDDRGTCVCGCGLASPAGALEKGGSDGS